MRAGWYRRRARPMRSLKLAKSDILEPGPGEVLVRVHASGINPSDYKRRANVKSPPNIRACSRAASDGETCSENGCGRARACARATEVWVCDAQCGGARTVRRRNVLPAGALREAAAGKHRFRRRRMPRHSRHDGLSCRQSWWRYTGQDSVLPGATGRVGAYAVQIRKRRVRG